MPQGKTLTVLIEAENRAKGIVEKAEKEAKELRERTERESREVIEEARKHRAELICMSALLTTTMTGQGRVISMFEENGLREQTKFLVGGAPATDSWARQIGADAYAADAIEG